MSGFDRSSVPYHSRAEPRASVELIAAVGRLHGVPVADPATASILEVACGDAVNLLTIAAALPDAECVGLDLDQGAIARGRELRNRAGLDRVDLAQGDVQTFDPGDTFDYVIAHGFWSWVPDEAREALLGLMARCLAPAGIALISYNALPGAYLRRAVRAIARRAAGAIADPEEAARVARDALVISRRLNAGSGPYAQALEHETNRWSHSDPGVLFHDELADECTPFSLEDVAGRASGHGLAYLGEADPSQWWRWRLSPSALADLRSLASEDPLDLQIAADLAAGPTFKATLFTRAEDSGSGFDSGAAPDLVVRRSLTAAPNQETGSPAIAGAWMSILDAGPRGIRIRDLASGPGLSEQIAAGAALRLVASGQAMLRIDPAPVSAFAGERPRVTGLARAQAESGPWVSSLLHDAVKLDDDLIRGLVRAADGTRDRGQLADLVADEIRGERPSPESTRSAVDQALDHLGAVGLIEADL